MGIFTNNRYDSLGDYDIPADESYTYPTGCGRILSEIAQNDLTMFTALIQRDFEESALISEGYGGFNLEVLTEGVGDIFAKIAELFKKLLEKIKGIFKQFMAKFNSVVITDNKKYYDKYKKLVNGSVKWDGFKCKYSKQKSGITIEAFSTTAKTGWDKVLMELMRDNNMDASKAWHTWDKNAQEKFERDLIDDNEAEIKILNAGISGLKINDISDFNKEFHELFFEDEESIDDVHEIKTRVEQVLSQGEKFGKETDKLLKTLDKEVKNEVKEFEKIRKELVNAGPQFKDGKADNIELRGYYKDGSNDKLGTKKNNLTGNWDSTNDPAPSSGKNEFGDKAENGKAKYTDANKQTAGENATRFASAAYSIAQIWQNAITKVHTAYLNEIKFETKQCRSAFAAMVAHALRGKNQIGPNNESSLLEFAQEGAEFEFDSMFGIV